MTVFVPQVPATPTTNGWFADSDGFMLPYWVKDPDDEVLDYSFFWTGHFPQDDQIAKVGHTVDPALRFVSETFNAGSDLTTCWIGISSATVLGSWYFPKAHITLVTGRQMARIFGLYIADK
jgi:hypothetical protein